MRQALRDLKNELWGPFSLAAAHSLVAQDCWQRTKLLLSYMPAKGELNLFPLLGHSLEGKQVALPRFDPKTGFYTAALATGQLVPGPFGIAEPPPEAPVVPLNRLDLALVPGLAFDPLGRRLGRGKGFYDRLLVEVTGVKCGVALDEQIVPRLPAEAHDIRMDFILTPTRWLAISANGD
jgi:5-formyltetrahydrofolate cyclo-ligase